MRFSSVAAFAAIASSVLAAPAPAPAPTSPAAPATTNACLNKVISALNAVQSDLTTLDSKVVAFSDGLLDIGPLLTIQSEATGLGNDIQAATKQINKCSTFNEGDSLALAQVVLTLVPFINQTLSDIVVKKPAFDHSVLYLISVSWLVSSDITTLAKDTTALGTALTAKFDPILTSTVTQVLTEINAWFSSAESAYANSGLISLRRREE